VAPDARARVAIALALVLALAVPACGGRPSALPRARYEVATLLVLPERGPAAVAVDDAYVYVATWHGVTRATHTGASPIALYAAPLGGVTPTLLAADARQLYVIETRACDGDDSSFAAGARRRACARVVAVPKDGAPPFAVVTLPAGEPPRALAVDGGYVYLADKRRVLRVSSGGGATETVAEAEEDVRDVGAVDGHVFWVESDPLVQHPLGSLVTRNDVGVRRVLGLADAARSPLVFDGTWIHWVGAEKVWRADVHGGAPESLGEARAGETHVAADAVGVAWTEWDGARVALRSLGGLVQRVSLEGEKPTAVALWGPFAFVTTVHEEDGRTRLMRIAR
jgi:hypothetical protein